MRNHLLELQDSGESRKRELTIRLILATMYPDDNAHLLGYDAEVPMRWQVEYMWENLDEVEDALSKKGKDGKLVVDNLIAQSGREDDYNPIKKKLLQYKHFHIKTIL